MVGSVVGAVAAPLISGAIGGGGGRTVTAPVTTPFEQFPAEVQEFLTGEVFPQIRGLVGRPAPTVPLGRAPTLIDPTDPFQSRGLAELQAFSDAVGGLFPPPVARQLPVTPVTDGVTQPQISELLGRTEFAALPPQTAFGARQFGTGIPSPETSEDFAALGQAVQFVSDRGFDFNSPAGQQTLQEAVQAGDFSLEGIDQERLSPRFAQIAFPLFGGGR